MSRSYKRHPIIKDNGKSAKDRRREASSRVRNIPIESEESEALVNGGKSIYKKFYESWAIHDYVSRWTKEEATDYYNRMINNEASECHRFPLWRKKFLEKYPTLEDYLNKVWAKTHKRK